MNLSGIALRNLLREPKRTLNQVVGIGLVCAVLIVWMTLTSGFSRTIYGAATSLWIGKAQAHQHDYRYSESIYDTLPFDAEKLAQIDKLGFKAAPRLYTYALAAQREGSRGIRLMGVDPVHEEQVTKLHQHVIKGSWFAASDTSSDIVVGAGLAHDFKLDIGSELIILGQAVNGSLASGLVKVKGIMGPISEGMDQRSAYMVAPAFRDLFMMPDGIHELVLAASTTNDDDSKLDISGVASLYPGQDVRSWRELKPSLASVLDMLNYTVFLTLGFVFVALGALILNTKLMTILDRTKLYGVMRAVGMVERQVVIVILAETLWLCVFAGLFAAAVGIPCALYTQRHGIDFSFMLMHFSYFGLVIEPVLHGHFGLKQVLAPLLYMFVMLPLASLYPALVAAKTSPSVAMQTVGDR